MADNLKHKASVALIWNTLDKVGFQVIALLVGIITARMLSPRDFGLMGALSLFTILSNLLIESGFTSAMVRRANNTNADYTAVLALNVSIATCIYIVLFFCAPLIADFFRMPELTLLARVLFLTFIINAFGIVQNIVLQCELSFRLLSLSDLISAIVAGIVTIALILLDFGYWALAWQVILQSVTKVALLWIFSSWRIREAPNFAVIREVLSFSSFLLFTSLINTFVKNIYSLVIGRVFPAQHLGYYTQANKFQQIPSTVIQTSISGVAYPVFSKLNNNAERQLAYIRKIFRITALLTFPVMFGLMALMEPLVSLVLTDKWLPAVQMFNCLVLAAITFPFHSLCLNIINARGRSRVSFTLETVKNTLIILSLLTAYFLTQTNFFAFSHFQSFLNTNPSFFIILMLSGFSLASLLSYFIDLFVTQRFCNYRWIEQLKDILPYLLISLLMYALIHISGLAYSFFYKEAGTFSLAHQPIWLTILQMAFGVSFYFGVLYFTHSQVLSDAIHLLRHRS